MAKGSSLLREAVARCASWGDFVRQLKKKSDKEKGDLFEHLVRAYLQLDPEYATKLRKVWLLEDVPSALRKKLHLPASDQGIDLIAETNTAEYWAIQCKYREDTVRPLPWREISTFTGLAFGVCKHISFGLVCSTTERITRVLTHQDRIGFCALDVWQGLDKEFFDRLRKLLGHKPTKLVPLKPRPHQKKAIADARKYFVGKKQMRGKLISPCGSGKSLTAYWIARDLKAKKIVVAVPSLALIRQTLKVWLRESLAHGDTVEWICVCSDESAGRVEQDDVAVLRQDLGVPCLTDPKEIASWLKQKNPGLTVVFTTYQSGEALGKAARRAKFAFDLGIMDEAHKTVGDGDKLFSHLLHDKNLTIRRRIFMTATERRYRGKSDKILSMDNVAIYGDTFHLLSFKKALETKPVILSDYRIVTILVSREEVADLIRKNVFVKPDKGRWNKEIEAEMLASLVALRKAMRKYPIKHAVSFHSSIQRAEIFKDHNEAYNQAFKKHGTIETFHVSGKTATGTRARIVNEFAATERGLITNARCLTEGVDVPDIDCVMFADPRRSAVDIVQAVGRALRPAKGKRIGYVIVPLLHDARAKPDDLFDSDEFQEILTTLRALAANDERIIEYFRTVSQGKRRSGRGSIVFEIDEKLAKRINLERFARDIDLKCWARLAKLTWRPFEEARAYVHSLGLRSGDEWKSFAYGRGQALEAIPPDIPKRPDYYYANRGSVNMGDWLGTYTVANQAKQFANFARARRFARGLGLKSGAQWKAYVAGKLADAPELPKDIPKTPAHVYSNLGWKGMDDWLGTGRIPNSQRRYLSYAEARKFVVGLALKSAQEWMRYARGDRKDLPRLPSVIPKSPNRAYEGSGWKGIGHWLGTNRKSNQDILFLPLGEAKKVVHRLGLKTREEWFAYWAKKKPKGLPRNAAQTYDDKGWLGWGDWLGTGNLRGADRTYRIFKDARKFSRGLGLANQTAWRAFVKTNRLNPKALPKDIPSRPDHYYRSEGWISWHDWLGAPKPKTSRGVLREFSDARRFARGLRLKSGKAWEDFCDGKLSGYPTKPHDIPKFPHQSYDGKGWVSMSDWLGTESRRNRHRALRPFLDARAFVRPLKLCNQGQWREYTAGRLRVDGQPPIPVDIPTNPAVVYNGKGWKDWPDWLGYERKRKQSAAANKPALRRRRNHSTIQTSPKQTLQKQ